MASARAHEPGILIVEDEAIVAHDLQQTLTEQGYDAFAVAASADEALLRAAERCPDLVLMDIRLKGMRDGISAALELRKRFGAPVVYLTAHADDRTIDRAKISEPYGYLLKPVSAPELISRGFGESDELMSEMRDEAYDIVRELLADDIREIKLLQEHLHDGIGQLVYDRTRRRPMILPVVVEV